MIEKVILDYLNAEMTCPVKMETPKTPPEKYVLIEKTSSALDEHLYRSTIAIQSYAGTLYDAASLSAEVVELMAYGLDEKEEVISVSLNSEYNFTDTSTKKYRYQAVFDIAHY